MLDDLEGLVEAGYISRRKHPELDLHILNYTPRTQYEGLWNDTTEQCRGLIVDGSGGVVSRCFRKFFNYEQVRDEVALRLDAGVGFKAFDKLDGSLGISYWEGDRPRIATRGSFTSEQATRANAMLDRDYPRVRLDPSLTYLFEIIYPENRICVDYGDDERLVLLGSIHTESGEEVDPGGVPFPRPAPADAGSDFGSMAAMNLSNREGFVVRFDDGFRFKVKFEDYVALHSAIFSLSTRTIWDALREGRDVPLDLMPDEVYGWARAVERGLRRDYAAVESRAMEIFEAIRHLDRREFAASALEYRCSTVLFRMLDGRPYADHIWKMVEPEYRTPRHEEVHEDS
jgi:RNA ligase